MNNLLKYSLGLSLENKILYVFTILRKATSDDIAMEIMELDGMSTEEAVADLATETKQTLERMHKETILKKVSQANN